VLTSEGNGLGSLRFPLIVIGGGGHAKVLISTLLLLNRQILGYVDINRTLPSVLGVPNLGSDDVAFEHSPTGVRLVNGVGSIGPTRLRHTVFEKFAAKGYRFETVIHPFSFVAPDVDLGEGVQIMAGAVVQPGTRLGKNVIINTGACIDHDCLVECHSHIAPGATLSGGVQVRRGSQIGTGASVIQGITIGLQSIVGAGAVVIEDVPERVTVAGVPAAILAGRRSGR
jgi:sugar O-acyltransferase (sialic acid O-acetyltransferase NeuD family)